MLVDFPASTRGVRSVAAEASVFFEGVAEFEHLQMLGAMATQQAQRMQAIVVPQARGGSPF